MMTKQPKTIAWIFRTLPHTDTRGREGLDALLATASYSENLQVFFIDSGVMQLLKNQHPTTVYTRNHIDSFKLLDMYGLPCYFCQESLHQFGRQQEDLIIQPQPLSKTNIASMIHTCDHILTF